MQIVINKCFGGFSLSKNACKDLNCDTYDYNGFSERTDEKLIDLIKTKGSEYVSGPYAKLYIVEIPDESTDHTIYEYDGSEEVIYVLNGKLEYI